MQWKTLEGEKHLNEPWKQAGKSSEKELDFNGRHWKQRRRVSKGEKSNKKEEGATYNKKSKIEMD